MAADLFGAAIEVQQALSQRSWKFCFIGGLAVQHWGRPRVTDDIDVTLLTGFGGEEKFITELLSLYPSRVENPVEFGLRNRVLLLRTPDGFGIDVALGALEFEEHAVARAKDVELLPGTQLRLCTPEDLVVMKAFADRPLDWQDIVSIAQRQQGHLDWRYVLSQLQPLVEIKGATEILDRLRELQKKTSA